MHSIWGDVCWFGIYVIAVALLLITGWVFGVTTAPVPDTCVECINIPCEHCGETVRCDITWTVRKVDTKDD